MQVLNNFLNLPTVIKQGSTVKATYTYLADGTKIKAVNALGAGFDYIGSFKYNRSNSNITLESVASAGGRTYKTSSGYEARYFIADHLGSTRLVASANGTVSEQNDYMPYGERHSNSALAASTNPYLYNGKESQKDFGINYIDSEARFQRLDGAFNSIDPLSEKYYHISPYAYCAANPINMIDPTGNITDDWRIMLNGQLIFTKTTDSFDRFFIENINGEFNEIARLDKHITDQGITLVEFPNNGKGFTRYGEIDEGGDHFLQPSVAAALFGAIHDIYQYDNSIMIQLGDMSAFNGNKPGTAHNGGSTSHVNGRNIDVRYIRSDRKLSPLTVDDPNFDKSANQKMVDSFYKYGFKSQLSYPMTQDGWILNHTKSFKNHHHHLHIQGFSPTIINKKL